VKIGMNTVCPNCQLVQSELSSSGGFIYSDDLVILTHSRDTLIPGYLILLPKRHVEFYHELNDEELARITKVSKAASKAIAELPEVERVYLVSLGEEVRHFHWHLFPRYHWMVEEQEFYTQGKLDGTKVFSQARKRCRIVDSNVLDPKVLEIVEHFREKMKKL
jgi:diadenosine tetraphosphate (Ap4A) HIT family hydrolase